MDTYTEHDDSGSINKSEIPKELSVKSGELPIIITTGMKKYLPKDLLENIRKADKACREIKHNEKISYEKMVIPAKRVPHQMMLQSKATTTMVATAIKPRKSIKDALRFKSKEDWIKTIKSDVVEKTSSIWLQNDGHI